MKDDIVLQVGVKVLLKNKEGRCLLLRRSLDKYPDIVGRWDITGGRINPGQELFENLKREVKEETGLDLKEIPKLIAAQDILRASGRHVVRLTYVGYADGEVELDKEENDEFKWFTLEELVKLEDVDIYFRELLKSDLEFL